MIEIREIDLKRGRQSHEIKNESCDDQCIDAPDDWKKMRNYQR